jgi:recombinational DNA repair ATPase RecF
MLESLEAEGLNGRKAFNLNFNPDLNIFTGQNGSGKTTTLKLIWYLISANIERIPREMKFERIKLKGHNFSIEIKRKIGNVATRDQSRARREALERIGFRAVREGRV